ncbi:MAG: tetratricopeptide repeat protein [Bacteroidetes bacterium]|nr:tetratricopeptide repeat protein [Bacteroidota bacterium]
MSKKNGNYDLAFKYLKQSISLDSNNCRAYAELGNVFAMSGDYNNALINYNRSISLDKTNPYPYNSKGALYYQFSNVDSLAILNFNKALSLIKQTY